MKRTTEETANSKVISREKAFERLDHLLRFLEVSCNDMAFLWPPGWLLGAIDEYVMLLIGLERKKEPLPDWKTFKTLDKRRPSLRLVPRINRLAKRAIEGRKERCGESVLEKALRRPDSVETQILLRDFVEQNGKFVDLLDDHSVRIGERVHSWPLLHWLCGIDHPDAQNLILPDVEPAGLAGSFSRYRHLEKMSRKRLNNRERQKRYRERKNSLQEKRYVTPLQIRQNRSQS
jgi:hypothetical protein